MNDTPVIDLSLRPPRMIIADRGMLLGSVLVLWFRLVRPACVGLMWAAVTLYGYRYLMPFEKGDLSWAELISYLFAIGAMGAALTTWMILAHVAHPFTSKSRIQRLLRRKARVTVEPAPFDEALLGEAEARVLVASHDEQGQIEALRPVAVQPEAREKEEARVSAYRSRIAYRMGTPGRREPRD